MTVKKEATVKIIVDRLEMAGKALSLLGATEDDIVSFVGDKL